VTSMKRRIIAAATLPAAGFTMFAAAFALTAQPASAAPDDTNGIANGASVRLPINAPVDVCGIAAGVLGDATAKCAAARLAPTPGYEGPGRGQAGYGTPTPGGETPSPGGPGAGTPPETPSELPTPTPSGSVPGAGQQNVPPGGVSAGSPEAPTPTGGVQGEQSGGELPVTGLPLAGLAGAGALVTAGGAALVYAGRHRRRFEH
jgi:ChpA-C